MATRTPLVLTALSVILAAAGARAQTPPEPPTPAADPVTAAPAPAPAAAPAARPAVLEVTSDPPGLPVSLDGGLVGVTPLNLDNVAPGPHQVGVEQPGVVAAPRSITLTEGGLAVLHFATAAPPISAASILTEPARPSVGSAIKDVGFSILTDTPWVGFVVVAAVATTVVAALLWTTTPGELPFAEQLPSNIGDSQWRVLRFVGLGVAGGLGALALLLLLLPSTPLGKLGAVVDAAKGK